MFNEKLEAGRAISKQLLPSEDAIDGSIVQNAKLIISLIEGRKKMGVAAEVGHDAILSAAAGMAALSQARDHTVACHKQLASLRDDLGLSPRATGCSVGKLDPSTRLSVVQSEVA